MGAPRLWLEQYAEEYRAALSRAANERHPALEALRVQAIAEFPQEPTYAIDNRPYDQCRRLQPLIEKIASMLQELLPDRPMRQHFRKVVARAIGFGPEPISPEQATREARAILDAFYRAYCYLTEACEAGKNVEIPRKRPPHWWSTPLYIFELS